MFLPQLKQHYSIVMKTGEQLTLNPLKYFKIMMIVRVPLKLGQKLQRIPFHLTRSLKDFLLRRIETVLKAKSPVHLNNTYFTLKTQKECHFIIADLLLEPTKSMHK